MRIVTVAEVPYQALQRRTEQSGSLAIVTGFALNRIRMPAKCDTPSIDCNPLP